MYGLNTPKIETGEKEVTTTMSVIYAGFNRQAWAIACAWVVFACCRGYGGMAIFTLYNKNYVPYSIQLMSIAIIF